MLVHSAVLYLIPSRRGEAYRFCGGRLGRAILLGLEVFIIADIVSGWWLLLRLRAAWPCCHDRSDQELR